METLIHCDQNLKPSSLVSVQDCLFVSNKDWAKWLAHRKFAKYNHITSDIREFEQTAFEALIKCIQTFDQSKGVNFRTFAEYRINGAILNILPKLTEKSALYKSKSNLLDEELSPELDRPICALVDVIQDLAIDYMLQEEVAFEEQVCHGYTSPEYYTLVSSIKSFVTKLSSPKDIIIELYYLKGISITKIASVLELTKGRVSQLHQEALKELSSIFSK